ncbi:hypothetical protein [Thermoanaerobacterium sp. DL9XJH110]|uniref:hypothetical protein n=1 Tax=Thermoanaerobacterium sp. DL9XJH110 TaxID=3386643 RepID=UPI003BB544A8
MEYIIDTSKPVNLNWAAKDAERVAQNVRNLISTWRYEVAYDRTLGLDQSILDKPLDTAVALYVAEVYRLVADYEPRATVKEVKFTGVDDEGNMQFRVVIEV